MVFCFIELFLRDGRKVRIEVCAGTEGRPGRPHPTPVAYHSYSYTTGTRPVLQGSRFIPHNSTVRVLYEYSTSTRGFRAHCCGWGQNQSKANQLVVSLVRFEEKYTVPFCRYKQKNESSGPLLQRPTGARQGFHLPWYPALLRGRQYCTAPSVPDSLEPSVDSLPVALDLISEMRIAAVCATGLYCT